MYRSALVSLHPEHSNDALATYAVSLAREYGLRLRAVAVLDVDRVAPPEPVPLGAGPFKVERDELMIARTREGIARALADFESRCRAAGVPYELLAREDGLSSEIATVVQRCDVLLAGHTSGTELSGRRGESSPLHAILKQCPRPAIIVPAAPPGVGSVVVAYDGSVQAARALEAFVASGFLRSGEVHVVAFHPQEAAARQWADVAADYLRSHGYRAQGHAELPAGAVGEAILQALKRHSAQLLVMGAYGKSSIREFFFGSVTQRVLREASVPVLLDH